MAAADTLPARQHNGAADRRGSTSPVRDRSDNAQQPIGLGIDEEIKIRKPRKPLAKLDEERLLSHKGIPKLRKITKERLKFKGKGHEFSDVARVLTLYQLWLDDLFPKANFADGLAMVEKLGHSKRLRVMRKAWIDEEKPRPEAQDVSDDDAGFVVGNPNDLNDEDGIWREDGARQADDDASHPQGEDGDEDIYAAPKDLSARDAEHAEGVDVPEDDDLDGLFVDDPVADVTAPDHQPAKPTPVDNFDFADDEDAMADMW